MIALAVGTIQSRTFLHFVPPWTNWAIIGFFTVAALFVPGLRKNQVMILGSVGSAAEEAGGQRRLELDVDLRERGGGVREVIGVHEPDR